ncbi:pyrimidine 5'-nucleotidase, partial [Shewanella sp. 0m-11]
MQYKWVLFDADETLFHFDAFQGLQLMFSRFDVDFTRQDFLQYQTVNQPLWVDYQDGKLTA